MRALLLVLLLAACEPKPAAPATTPEHDAGQSATSGWSAVCANLDAKLGCGPVMFPGQTCAAATSHLAASGQPTDKLRSCWTKAASCDAALRCSQ